MTKSLTSLQIENEWEILAEPIQTVLRKSTVIIEEKNIQVKFFPIALFKRTAGNQHGY